MRSVALGVALAGVLVLGMASHCGARPPNGAHTHGTVSQMPSHNLDLSRLPDPRTFVQLLGVLLSGTNLSPGVRVCLVHHK
jgi:hypothetical protein